MATHSSILAGKSHGQRRLGAGRGVVTAHGVAELGMTQGRNNSDL